MPAFTCPACHQVVVVVTLPPPPDDDVAAIASLAPCDETGRGGPQIIGIYTHKAYRYGGSLRPASWERGPGVSLICVLAEESQRRYGVAPSIVPATTAGQRLCERARADGIDFHLVKTLAAPIDL